MTFTEKIERLLASGHLDEVINEFLDFLNDVPSSNEDAKSKANEIKGQILVLSGEYADLSDNLTKNTMGSDAVRNAKANLTNRFFQVLQKMPSNYALDKYMKEKNEEDEWKDAQKENNIEVYTDYFNKYPDGKYKEDTIKLIKKLEEVKDEQLRTIKEMAALEKARREKDNTATGNAKPLTAANTSPAYQSASATGAPAPAPAYQANAPVYTSNKNTGSKNWLYIALGVLIGVLLIIIIAVAVSDDEQSTTPVVNGTVKENTGASTSIGWTKIEKTQFLAECQGTAVQSVGSDRAVAYCECMLEKFETMFANYNEASIEMSKLTLEEINAMAADCVR